MVKRLCERVSVVPVLPVVVCVGMVVVWQIVCSAGLVPGYLLPSPADVARACVTDAPLLANHAKTTLCEAVFGLGIGVAFGVCLAFLMDRFEVIYRAFEPLIVVSQTIPTIAIAPLLVLWFGYGLLPKIVLVTMTTFFPITITLIASFRSIDSDYVDLMRLMGASWWQILFWAKVPFAVEEFFAGLRVSATYAVVTAVIAEWLGGFSGLGVYMMRVRKSYAYDRMFASIVVISFCSLLLIVAIKALQSAVMPWKRVGRKKNET